MAFLSVEISSDKDVSSSTRERKIFILACVVSSIVKTRLRPLSGCSQVVSHCFYIEVSVSIPSTSLS